MDESMFLKGKCHHLSLSYSDKVIRLVPSTDEEVYALKTICRQLKVRVSTPHCVYNMFTGLC